MNGSMHAVVGLAIGIALSVIIVGLIASGRRRRGDDRSTAERIISHPLVSLITFGVPVVSFVLLLVLS